MNPKNDLIGARFGRLLVLSFVDRNKRGQSRLAAMCDCGSEVLVKATNLRTGNTKSCGCLRTEMKAERKFVHGQSHDPTYKTWVSMLQRCINPRVPAYERYGGRGISVCAAWGSFTGFLADMGDRPAGTTIDRIDVNGNYEPGNCRWADAKTQQRNKTTTKRHHFNGVTATIGELCEMFGGNAKTAASRLSRGASIELAMSPGRLPRGSIEQLRKEGA